MQNSEYWKLRFEQLEAAQNGQGAAAVAEIERQYKEAQKQIEGQIARWYQRFADNNGISLAEARQYLKGAALKEFKWYVQDYIKYGQENALMGGWVKELENASAKYHISKLEALKIQTQQSLEVMFSKQLGTVTGAMGNVFESGYYHTAYELQKGFNIGWDIAGLDQSQIEKVLAKPWAADGYNFSERIWKNKNRLISEVHGELTQNIMLGADPQKAIDSLAKKMKTSRYNAGRLIMTEEAYFSSAAQKDCFEELGVEQFEIVATLDSHTSDICRSLDGKHFPMKDYQAGVTAPPFHVYCRSTTVPYFDEDFGDIGERAARGEDGKTYYVPADMNYQDWKEAFVDGGDKSGFVSREEGEEQERKKRGEKAVNDFWKEKNAQHKPDNVKIYSEVQDEYKKNATPGQGKITRDNNYNEKLHKNEISFADWLHNYYGGDIKLLEEINQDKVLTPDYVWNGKLWDLKTVTTEKGANSAVRKGLHQIKDNPGGIFLNFENNNISIDIVIKIIEARMKWYLDQRADIVIVQHGEVTKVLRFERKI